MTDVFPNRCGELMNLSGRGGDQLTKKAGGGKKIKVE
jgi:hypothetical protein